MNHLAPEDRCRADELGSIVTKAISSARHIRDTASVKENWSAAQQQTDKLEDLQSLIDGLRKQADAKSYLGSARTVISAAHSLGIDQHETTDNLVFIETMTDKYVVSSSGAKRQRTA